MTNRIKGISARTVYYIISAGLTLAGAVMFTVLGYYYVTRIGMDPLQLVLVGTVLEGTILLFELPTGVVADTFSRRLSVTIGMFILAAAWLIEGSFPLFGMVLVAEAIRGVGETFLSGALDAWLADEVGEENVGQVYVRSGQINRAVSIAGTVLSVGLASIVINLPVLAGGGIYLAMGIFLLLAMPETGFKPLPRAERSSFRAAAQTFKTGARVVRGSSLLITLLVVNAVAGGASEGFDRLWEAHFLLDITFPALGSLQPVVWFGILGILGSFLGLGITALFQKRIEAISQDVRASAKALIGLNVVMVLGLVGFALARSFPLGLAALLVNWSAASLYYPLYNSWLVQNIKPEVRATVLSMVSQTNALGQTAGGPALGAIGSLASIRAALVVAGVLVSSNSFLFGRMLRGEKTASSGNQPVSEAGAAVSEG